MLIVVASHITSSLGIEFKVTIIFLTQAIIATFFGLSDANNLDKWH
jgi:hypothetical protein